MNNKEINSNTKIYQDRWGHDGFSELNKEDKSSNQNKNKIKKAYNRFNDLSEPIISVVNSKTLVADFIDPRKQQMKKNNVSLKL